MRQGTRRGFVRAEGLVLMVLLLVSLAVLGWVFVQMYRHAKAQQAALLAAPQKVVTQAPVAAAAEQAAAASEQGVAAAPAQRAAEETEAEAAAASLPDPNAAAMTADMAAYSNAIATLKAQLDLVRQTRDQEQADALGRLQEQLRSLREELAQQQTQAFLAERELLRAHLRVDSAQEALVRAQNELRAKDAEILRLRQIIEELSGIEPPMLQPAAFTNAAVDSVPRTVGGARALQAGKAAPAASREPVSPEPVDATVSSAEPQALHGGVPPAHGAEVRAPDVVAPRPSFVEDGDERPARSAWRPRPARAAARTARPARQIYTPTPASADATPLVPTRVTHVDAMPVTNIATVATELELGERSLETASGPAGAGADEYALQTEGTELGAPQAPPRPEFAPERGARPSLTGMLNGGYRIVCAPFMVPYSIVSGAAVPLRNDPEQAGTTNYLAYGVGQALALPFSMGFNSIAGAGSGSMDALQGCLDIITLGTYSGTGAQPYIKHVLDTK